MGKELIQWVKILTINSDESVFPLILNIIIKLEIGT